VIVLDKNEKALEIIALTKKIMHLFRQSMEKEMRTIDFTESQGLVVRTLAHYGDMKVSDMSKRLDLSNSTVSGIIERLVKKGVVERKRSEEDRRIVMISLTEEHRRDFKLHFDLLKKKMESVMTIGTEKDIDFILTALKKLKAILEEAQKYEKEGEKECLN